MQRYKFLNIITLGLLISTIFASSLILFVRDSTSYERPVVIDQFIPRLNGGNVTAYTKFYNSSGTYRTSGGSTVQLESSVGGGGSSIDFPSIRSPSFAIGESNETHIWVQDPTNKTEGYYIEIGSGYQELFSSRGQTNRHWYNETSNEYTFGSDLLVNKTNVVEGTDWVTEDEYPNRFIIRLTNGSIYTRETPDEMNILISTIGDNSSIWAVGYESFAGVFGFYLNFQDTDWGHAQYVFWPRLKNGQISNYNQPLYAMYPHLYAKYNDLWYDKILNDRSLYVEPYQNPRNTLNFFNTSDTFGIYFSTNDISILSSTWDFTHGFKFNFTDQQYHLITRFQCKDRSFQDIGMGYEITSSPQSDNTPYQPDRFLLVNDTHSVIANISQAWQAGTYLEDYYSQVQIISQNDESFSFTFDDMETTGFTEKYLELHNQTFPNGEWRYVLLAGMYGYGAYTQDNWIEIDPDVVGPTFSTDNYDLSWSGGVFQGGYTTFYCGYRGDADNDRGYIAFDTGLSVKVVSTSAVALQLYTYGLQMKMETGAEGIDGKVYAVKSDNDNDDQARENSLNYADTDYYAVAEYPNSVLDGDHYLESEYHTLYAAPMEILTDYWGENRDNADSYISFYFYGNSYADSGTDDAYAFYDSQYTGTDRDPILTFTYESNAAPNTPTLYAGSGDTYAGKTHTIVSDHTDPDGDTDIDTMHLRYDAPLTANDIAMHCHQSVSSGSATIDTGATFVISATYTHATDPTDGYRVTWTVELDWDWSDVDDVEYTVDLWTTDSVPQQTFAHNVEYNTFENDLIINDITYTGEAYPNGIETGGGSTLQDNEWFLGGMDMVVTGNIRYQGATSIYPDNDAVDIELYAGETGWLGDSYDDETLANGAFTIPTYVTPTSEGVSGNLNINYDFSVRLEDGSGDWTTANWDTGSSANYYIDSSRDNQNPTPVTVDTSYQLEVAYGDYLYWDSSNTKWWYGDDMSTNEAEFTCGIDSSDGSGIGLSYSIAADNLGGDDGERTDSTEDTNSGRTYDVPVVDITSADTWTGSLTITVYDLVGNSATTSVTVDRDIVAPYSYFVTMPPGPYSDEIINDTTPLITGWSWIEADSGLHSTPFDFGWRRDGGGWTYSGYQSDDTWTPTIDSQSQDVDFAFRVKDNVGNVGAYVFDSDNTIDTSVPAFTNIGGSESSDYLYALGATTDNGYYSDNMGATPTDFNVIGDITDNYGLNRAYASLVFGDTPSHLGLSGVSDSFSCTYTVTTGYSGTLVATITIIDNAGNSAQDTYTFYEDNTAPTTTPDSPLIVENNPHTYIYYDDSLTVYFSDLMSTTDQLFTVTVTADDTGGATLYGVRMTAWDDETDIYDTDGTYVRQYSTDSDEVTGSITLTAYDKVGNLDATPITITMQEDTAAPTMDSIVVTGDGTVTGYEDWDQNGASFSVDFSTTSDGSGSGLPTNHWYVEYNDATPDLYLTGTDPYPYTPDVGDGTANPYVFYARPVDNVGNLGTVQNDNGYIDEINPVISTTEFQNEDWDSGTTCWFDQGDIATATFRIPFTETNVYEIIVTATGGLAPSDGGVDESNPFDSSISITGQDDMGAQTISITLRDKSGRTDTDYSGDNAIALDDTNPVLTDPMSGYEENSGDFDYIYGDISIDTTYFSNDPTFYVVFGFYATGTDTGGSGVRGIDFGVWGDDNPAEDTSSPYWGGYDAFVDDTAGSITVIIYDKVGNSDSDTVTMTEDDTNPVVTQTGEVESSIYLYKEYGTIAQGCYGSGMGSVQTFTISGTASDASSGVSNLTDNSDFGNNPSNGGSITSWSFAYTIDSADNGDVTVTYTATDNVNNTATDTYTFYEDNVNPTLSDAMSAYNEDSGDTGDVYGVISTNRFYFSNSIPSSATVTFTATGTDSLANVRGIDFGAFGEDPAEDTESPYTGQYIITNTDSAGSITVRIFDNVDNNASNTITCIEDTSTTITHTTGATSESSAYLYYSGSGTVGYYGDDMPSVQTFTIGGTYTETDSPDASNSGLTSIADDTSIGDNPSVTASGGAWDFDYTLDSGDTTSPTITYTVTDNVGNTNTAQFTLNRDTTNPTSYTHSLTADESDIGYDPNTGYYDDDSVDVSTSGATDGSGSGLHDSSPYAFQRESLGWSSWQVGTTYTFTSVVDGSYDLYVHVRDNVNNNGSAVEITGGDDNDVTVDTDSPTAFTTAWTDADGWGSSDYAYLSGSTIYYKSNHDIGDYFNVEVPSSPGTIQNSGFWKVEWDKNSVFETGENDTSGLPDNKNFVYFGDSDSANFIIRVVNNAGNYQTFTFTPDVDTEVPTTSFTSITENAPHTYIFNPSATQTVYFSNGMSSTDQLFTVVVGTGDTGGAGVYGVLMGAWSDEQSAIYDDSDPYSRQYSVDIDETSGSIDIKTYDQVGNYDLTSVVITMTEDAIDPSFSVTWNFNANDWFVKSGSDFGMTNIDLTSVQDTSAGLDYVQIDMWNGSWLDYRVIASGLNGDNTEKSYLDEYRYATDDGESTGDYLNDQYTSDSWNIRVYTYDMVHNLAIETRYVRLDRNPPDSYSLVMESGYFYASITNDSTPLLTTSGATDNGGSGLHATPYYYGWRVDGGSWTYSGWESSDTYDGFTITESQDVDFLVVARDVVGNENWVLMPNDNDNTVDLSDPTIDSFTPSESSNFLYYSGSGTDGYYGSEMGSAQTYSFSGTSSDNYNLELINSTTTFGDSPSDSSPASYSLSYTIESADNGQKDITFVLFDQGGNRDTQTFTFYEDNTAPTINTLDISHTTDTDSDGGNDIPPVDTYEDDLSSWSVSLSGSATDSGSGLPSTQYSFTIGAQSQSNWQSGTTFAYTSGSFTLAEGSNDLKVIVQDNVNNSASLDTVSIIADTDSPTGSNSYEEITSGEYLYNPTSTYLYYADHQAVFNLTGTISTHGGSGNYGVRFTDAFDLVANTTDTSDPYEWQYEVNIGDSDTIIYVVLYNNAGNSHQIDITLDKDTTAPTGTITNIVESSDFLYDVGGTTTLWYGDDMSSAQSFTISLTTHNDAEAGIWKMTGEAFFGESLKTDYTSDYNFFYSPDSSDTETGVLSIIAYDNVNNYQEVDTITVYRDTTVDAPTVSSLSESSESLHTSGVTTFWYSEVMGSTEQTLTVTIGATDAGGSGVYCVEFPAKFGESAWNDTSSTYDRNFGLSSSDTDTGTITMYSYDNVGNTNSISFTTYKDTTTGETTFSHFTESSFYLYTSGETIYFSDESFIDESCIFVVNSADQGSNPSGVYKVLFGAWAEQGTWNDTESTWARTYYFDGDDSAGTITIKMYDNVGNLESSLQITVTKLTEAPTITIDDVAESSEWLYNQSLTQFYYGDDMPSAQTFTLSCLVNYAGVDGILKANTTAVWFGDSPSDSSDPYNLVFDISSPATDEGSLIVIVWTNTGKNGTDTITITRDTTAPVAYVLSSPAYDGDGNVTVTGSTTDVGAGMRTTNVYEWWVNTTRDHSPATAWTNTGSYEWLNLLEALQTFYGAAYDNVGNWQNASTSQTQVDFSAPEIYWTYTWVDDISYFYLETTNNTQQTVVICYYDASYHVFEVFLNFTAWDLAGGNLENVTYSTKFSDSPPVDVAPGYYNATYTIELNHSPEDSNNATIVIATATDNVGLTSTVSIYFYRDLMFPTLDLTIDDDPDALLDLGDYYSWYNDTSVDTTATNPADGDSPPNSDLPTNYLAYKFNSSGGDNSYGSWESDLTKQQTVDGTGTWWLWVKIRDYLGHEREYNTTAYVDLINPVINSVTFTDETYSPNWYKEEDGTASFDASWTETNAYLVNVSQSSLSYQENDNDPSGSSSSFSTTISGASHGYYNLTFMAYDNAGNRVIYITTLTENIRIDNNAPSISWLAGSTSESSNYLYFDGSNDWGYYSDKMGGTTVDFTVGGSATDTGSVESGVATITDNTNFGDNPSNTGSPTAWTFVYSIDQSDNGDITITYTATDNVGNINTDTFDFYEDTANPTITWVSSLTNESSPYLYYSGSSQYGYYSDNMGVSIDNYTIGGTASDTESDLYTIADNTDFGNNPARSGSLSSWAFVYSIDQDDDSYSTFTVTYTATDLVNNTATDTFEFRLDNTNPAISLTTGSISESSDYLYYDGSSAYGYYSDNMDTTLTDFIIAGLSSDGGSALNTTFDIVDNTVFGNDPSNTGSTSSWTFTYAIDNADSSYNTFYVTYEVIDYCNNTNTVQFQFIEDNTDPAIEFQDISSFEDSNHLYYPLPEGIEDYAINNGSWGVDGWSWQEGTLDGWTESGGGTFYTTNVGWLNDTITHENAYTKPTLNNLDIDGSLYNYILIRVYLIEPDSNDIIKINEINYGETGSRTFSYGSSPYVLSTGWNIILIDMSDWSAWTSNMMSKLTITFYHGDGTSTYDFEMNEKLYFDYIRVLDPPSGYTPSSSDFNQTIGYYSDNMLSTLTNFTVGGASYDANSGLYVVEDNTTFGNNPLNDGTVGTWNFTYQIDQNDDSSGSFNITYTVKDKCNNSATSWFYFYLDNDNPSISLDTDEITETSPYLYYNTTDQPAYGFYSDNMQSSLVNFLINGTCSDGGSSIQWFGDNTTFGNDPANTGTNASWSFNYQIDQNDNGNWIVVYTVTDYCNNNNTVNFTFYEDTTAPSGTFTLTQDTDALVNNWDNDTIINTVLSSLSDSICGYNSTHPVKYQLDTNGWDDWNNILDKDTTVTEGTRILYIAFHDYCNNTVEYNITVYVDLVDPIIDEFLWNDPQYGTQFYKSTYNTAESKVLWTETNIYQTNISCSGLSYNGYDYSPSGGYSLFNPTITGASSQYYNFTVMIYDNAGNRDVYVTSGVDTLYIDDEGPTYTFLLVQDGDAHVTNYYNDTTAYVQFSSYNDGVNGSGAPAMPYQYNINGGGWFGPMSDTIWQRSSLTETNHTFGGRAGDNLGNIGTYLYDWVLVDITDPILQWLTLNESWAPNWYDQSVSSVAQASINWVDDNPYHVNATCTLSHPDDLTPSGGNSLINFTITGEADGSYSIVITIYDKAGNWDNTLLGSEAPIQLESGKDALENEVWVYFRYFNSKGFLIDWDNFNTTYVLDEDYRNYTEVMFYSDQLYMNVTSDIRIITYNIFDDNIHNTSYSVPGSRVLNIILAVYTLKIANIYDEIMNSTIVSTGATEYDEQIMPYEIVALQMYMGTYNITVYIHGTSTLALNENGDTLLDHQIDITSDDFALFVDAPLDFDEIGMIISEIWQFNIVTNKDHKDTDPSINIYLNGSAQTGSPYTPGTIVLSRPQQGYYNLTIYATWQSYTTTYQRWLTVESNAEVTTFIVSGLDVGTSIIAVAWNTNKGTAILNIYDNTSSIATDSTEGSYLFTKSSTVGLHLLEFNISVETKIFSYYADYTIADWSTTVDIEVYDSNNEYVGIEDYHTVTLTVTRSDDVVFTGTVYVNTTTEVTIIGGTGSFVIYDADVERELYTATSVYDVTNSSRSFTSLDLTVTFDELIGYAKNTGITGSSAFFSITFNNSYDGELVTNFEYTVYIEEVSTNKIKEYGTFQDSTFRVDGLPAGSYYVEFRSIRSIDDENVIAGRCGRVPFTIEESEFDTFMENTVAPSIPFLFLLGCILCFGLFVRFMGGKQNPSNPYKDTPSPYKSKSSINWKNIALIGGIIGAIVLVSIVPQLGVGPALEGVVVFERPVDGQTIVGDDFYLTFIIHVTPQNLLSLKIMSYELTLEHSGVERSLLLEENVNPSSAFTIRKATMLDNTGRYVCTLKLKVEWKERNYNVKEQITFYYETPNES